MGENIFLGQTVPDDYDPDLKKGRSRSDSSSTENDTIPTDRSSSYNTGENQESASSASESVFLPEEDNSQEKPKNNLLLYLGAGILLYFLIKKRK